MFLTHRFGSVEEYLKEGQYPFSDIRKEGIVLYELDDEQLPEPEPLTPAERLRAAKEHFDSKFTFAEGMLDGSRFQLS